PSGAIPWFSGGHTDPWDHIENAMALSCVGMFDAAEGAYEWSRRTQRADGSWPLQVRNGVIEDPHADTNFCAYIATGVWHHVLITGSRRFAARMWPMVRKAIDFVLDLQNEMGAIGWARTPDGGCAEALLTGSSSIHQSLRCALALAEHVGDPQPEWEVAVGRLQHVVAHHPEAFLEKERYSMDWYYPILGGALRGSAAQSRIDECWDEFVVDGLGIRCVSDRPWVTGAETCELVLSLDALDRRMQALDLLAAMQHLRESDGSYWTGLVYTDGKRWPVERTTWTGAAVVLAVDALSRTTPGNGIFRGDDLPRGLAGEYTCECVRQR
ncbi:MAG: prenyltransferase, partial [Aldersonia sp.]|nr:prenyltransferase [Aldersonia sp.]